MPNINGFISNLKNNPLQRANRYKIQIMGPLGALSREVLMNCSSSNIPGRSFDTTEFYNYGPVRKIPYSEIFGPLTTNFYMREDLSDFQYFYDWQDLIGTSNDANEYGIAYYDNIVGNVTFQPVTDDGSTERSIFLYEAYPLDISEIPFDYGSANQFASYSITWAYHHYRLE